MSKEDCVIICGDFGGVWDGSAEERHWLDWLEAKPYTSLAISFSDTTIRTDLYGKNIFCCMSRLSSWSCEKRPAGRESDRLPPCRRLFQLNCDWPTRMETKICTTTCQQKRSCSTRRDE